MRIQVLREPQATPEANATNIAMGIIFVYQATGPTTIAWAAIPYSSPSLNILLTLMIVIRLTLHVRGVQAVMGGIGSGGLCKAIVTMFVESCAINAVTSVLVLGLFGAGNDTMDIFLPILGLRFVLSQDCGLQKGHLM